MQWVVLLVEYKHMLILKNSSYVSDYHRRLEKYLEEVEGKEFLGKSRYVKKIKKEIMEIGNGLNSREESTVDEIHKKHIENEKEKNAMSAGITDMPAVFMQ